MNALFFDTETTGFVRRSLPWDHPSRPRVVQLAAVMQLEPGVDICSLDVILRHDGLEIPEGAAEIHGITTERMMDVGVSPKLAVMLFRDMATKAGSARSAPNARSPQWRRSWKRWKG